MSQLFKSISFSWIGCLAFYGLNAQIQPGDILYPEESIEIVEDIPYHTYARNLGGTASLVRQFKPEWEKSFTRTLKADFYRPPQEATKWRPLIIFCHQGVDVGNHKAENSAKRFATKMAQKGFAVASIGYRHAAFGIQQGISPYYLAAQDVNAAAHFFAQHAASFEINPNAIIFAGEGLGATAALHAAFWDSSELRGSNAQGLDEYYGSIRSQGSGSNPPAPIVVINIGGGILDTSMLQDESIPVLSIHGTLDSRVRFNRGIPKTAFSTSVDYYWVRLKKLLAIDRDPRFISERLPLYGSNLIHAQLESHSPRSQLIPLYGEKDQLIVSRMNNNLRSTSRAIFDHSTAFLRKELRDTVIITGDGRAIAGIAQTYTASTTAGIAYSWRKSEHGVFIGDSTGYSVTILWSKPGADNFIFLSMRNSMGFWSTESSFQVEVTRPIESPPALSSTNPLLILTIALLSGILTFVVFLLYQKKNKGEYSS